MTAGAPGDGPSAVLQGKLSRLWRSVLRSPLTELFEFEAERGRVRLGGLSAATRWLTVLGLATTGLLMAAVLVPGILAVGSSTLVPARPKVLQVENGTTAVTLVFLGIAWELVVVGALRSSRSMRVAIGVLFLLVNGFLVAGLPVSMPGGTGVTVAVDIARASLVAAAVGLVMSALFETFPSCVVLRPLWRWTTQVAAVSVFVALVFAEDAGRATPQVFRYLANGVVFTVALLILLLAPLLYLSGMAVLSLCYAVGAAATQLTRKLRRGAVVAVAGALVVGEAWFYGWHNRAQLWPGPRGWVVLLHVVPVVVGFGAIVLAGRGALAKHPEPVHDSASAAVALLVTVPSITGGLYFALWNASTLGFLHVPARISHALGSFDTTFVSTVVATGPRCALFGIAASVALAVAYYRGSSLRRRQFAVGVALMSGWVFWTQFVDWLPGTDTANDSLLALVAIGLVVAYWVASFALALGGARRPPELPSAIGTLAVVWLFAAAEGPLRQLGQLVPVESGVIVVVGVLLVLLGKSQFTGGTSPALPRSARVLLWTGYIVLSLVVIYWDRSVSGFFEFAGRNAEVSVLKFVAVPYLAWLVISGRFRTRPENAGDGGATPRAAPPGPAAPPPVRSPEDAEEPLDAANSRLRSRRRAAAIAIVSAAALCGGAWGAYAIDTWGGQRRVIGRGVSIRVPSRWTMERQSAFVIASRHGPAAMFAVFVGPSFTGNARTDLSAFMSKQRVLSSVSLRQATLIPSPPGGNFKEAELAHLTALYGHRRVLGNAFSFLDARGRLMTAGAMFAFNRASYTRVSGQMASMLNSLDKKPGPGLW